MYVCECVRVYVYVCVYQAHEYQIRVYQVCVCIPGTYVPDSQSTYVWLNVDIQ